MRVARPHIYFAVAAISLGVGVFAWSATRAPSLSFRDRTYPEGFRELVLANAASRFDPLVMLPASAPQPAASRATMPQLCDALFRDAASPATGRSDAPVQIAAFLDYRCPYCRTLAGILTAALSPDVRLIYKEWPILGEGSQLAARAALAADRQGQYAAFHARLMNTRLIPTERLIDDIAVELAIDPARLREDMRSPPIAAAIARTAALAQALGFIGTPALVVGRTVAQGEITRWQLGRLIEQEQAPSAKMC
jgi:protein-disulfide isomerase